MVDVDFLCVEYDNGTPVAMVEYKNEQAPPIVIRGNKSWNALRETAKRARLPLFAVRYASNFSWWLVVPLDKLAKNHLLERQKMTEKEWVTLLYGLRGRKLPPMLFNNATHLEHGET